MCGRFSLATAPVAVAAVFELEEIPALSPRYNIAPTQQIAAIRQTESGKRELIPLRWGLVPPWAEDISIGSRMLNARAESIIEKRSYNRPLASRRCLIPADGFFEWQKIGRARQALYFRVDDGQPFGIAGLWEKWSRGSDSCESCTLITTEANNLVRTAHDRMPVILLPEHYAAWLDSSHHPPKNVLPLLCPFPPERMKATSVGTRVHSPLHDDPECIQPTTTINPPRQATLFDVA